jgi:hypothetical protein
MALAFKRLPYLLDLWTPVLISQRGGLASKIHARCGAAGAQSALLRTAYRVYPDQLRGLRLHRSRLARGDHWDFQDFRV